MSPLLLLLVRACAWEGSYVRLAFNAAGVPEALLPLLPLYARCLSQVGTQKSTEVCCVVLCCG